MNKFFIKTGRVLGYFIALFIICLALLVMIGRLVTPVLNDHRADFERWTSQFLKVPVQISAIRVTWYRYQPQITFDHVAILSADTHQPVFKVQQVRVFFSLWRSLWDRKPVPDAVLIKGTEATLEETASGDITVAGLSALPQLQGDLLQDTAPLAMLGWLALPPQLMLEDVVIRYRLPQIKTPIVLSIKKFNLKNYDQQHALSGNVVLQQAIPTALTLSAQWRGDITQPAQVQGHIYLYVEGASLPQWLQGQSLAGWELTRGLGSAKIWASWEKGGWSKVQSSFTLYALSLYSQADKSTHVINRLSGDVGWKQEGQNQVIAGDDILIDLPSHLLPMSHFYLVLVPNRQGQWQPKSLRLGYLDLGDMLPFVFSTGLISDNIKTHLAKLHVDGVLEETTLDFPEVWDDLMHANVAAHFHNLAFSAVNVFPGVSHVSGRLAWQGKAGSLVLDSKQTIFTYPRVFTYPLILDTVQGTIKIAANTEQAWVMQIPELHLANKDLDVHVQGSMVLPVSASPIADLSVDFALYHVKQVKKYLPMKTFDKYLVNWLETAFLSGAVSKGKAVLQGQLTDFPFAQGNGKFLITGQVNDVDLRYDADWPLIQHIDGEIIFSGATMTVDIHSGKVMDIPLAATRGVIPYIGDAAPQILDIHGSVNTDLRQGWRFIQASPLRDTIGKAFSNTELSGPIKLDLTLTIPLSHPKDSKVQGIMDMQHVALLAPLWRLALDEVNGQLHFTESQVTAEQLQGRLLDEPVILSLKTLPLNQQSSYVKASLTGRLSMDTLQRWLEMPSLTAVAQGETAYQADLDFAWDAPLKVTLHTDLQGVALQLPQPYAKTAAETKAFQATLIAQQPVQARLDYADRLSAAIKFQKTAQGFQLVNGELHIGPGVANWRNTPGWYVTGSFDQLNWSDIQTYWQPSSLPLQVSALHSIDVQAQGLTLFGQHLTRPHVQIIPAGRVWDVAITSAEAQGKLHIPQQWTPKAHIDAEFQYLYLQSMPDSQSTIAVDPKLLPSISLASNDVRYGSSQLGHVELTTVPSRNGLSIKTLRVSSPYLRLQASGSWQSTAGRMVSVLAGNMRSSRVSKLLQQWGMDTQNIILDKGEINFDFHWPGAPYDLAMSRLSGNVTLHLGKGRILESETSSAQMGIGRMLSLFSLQTIPRRLTFDFSDLFEKGYSFDSMRGDFILRNGDALTNDALFDGPVARIRVAGRIGLQRKDYDMKLEVTPYVTSSIPVAATLLTGQPAIGVAAWIVNKVIGSQVSKVASHNYIVTGSWANPEWRSAS
ncbi:MAG: TIGR02099 family protein [Gammaproteobacteria bacterium RIFCSPHIGHO2_12_FULL_41_20]|nr:MAG: TIGR02099 family protein [Gammaproteobacteria bacterium RIFCSPHIGHO2_12_FULL_41_20]